MIERSAGHKVKVLKSLLACSNYIRDRQLELPDFSMLEQGMRHLTLTLTLKTGQINKCPQTK